ncbi:MAG: NYN domain-containing protein [Rhodospirillaceae bacterium]|nr:NYN domain-containing protein [Rhodospirillaceae bacterium]
MRTIVYVDSFNLYYRLLKQQPRFKWLNVCELARQVLRPSNQVTRVNFYTARVSGRRDPHAPARQQVYFDALATVPEISLHFGNFLMAEKWSELVHPPQFRPGTTIAPPWPTVVRVLKTEEKGSDVNLAAHLVRDALTGAFDVAAVLSNDTDLVEPIRIVARECNLPVGLIAPVKKPAAGLVGVSSFVRHIRSHHLAVAQFHDPVPGTAIRKPPTWV